jgi:hypothetical protein
MKNWQIGVAAVIGFVAFKLVDVTYIHPPTPEQRAEWAQQEAHQARQVELWNKEIEDGERIRRGQHPLMTNRECLEIDGHIPADCDAELDIRSPIPKPVYVVPRP